MRWSARATAPRSAPAPATTWPQPWDSGCEPGDVAVSIGTSGVASMVTAEPVSDGTGAISGFADATGRFLPLAATINAARILELGAQLLGVDHDGLAELALESVPGRPRAHPAPLPRRRAHPAASRRRRHAARTDHRDHPRRPRACPRRGAAVQPGRRGRRARRGLGSPSRPAAADRWCRPQPRPSSRWHRWSSTPRSCSPTPPSTSPSAPHARRRGPSPATEHPPEWHVHTTDLPTGQTLAGLRDDYALLRGRTATWND